MPEKPFTANTLTDALASFEAGMDAGIAPQLLAPNQLGNATNATVRGDFATHRPAFRKMNLSFPAGTAQQNFEQALWQGATYFAPDSPQNPSLVAAIGGRLFNITPMGGNAVVNDVTIPSDANPPTVPQAWLWQAEKWIIWNDGQSTPVIFDGMTTSRLAGNLPNILFHTTSTFTSPAIGGTVDLTAASGMQTNIGSTMYISTGIYKLVQFNPGPPTTPGPFLYRVQNISATPAQNIASGTAAYSATPSGDGLPVGRMGAYGMGRNWVVLPDGRTFIGSDIVGGASGTAANAFRDAILHVTENDYLVSGKVFFVPGNIGDIRSLIFATILDTSLGQGPLQIFTPNRAFSCYAPVNLTTLIDIQGWKDVTNPILTQSLISNGALGYYSTVNMNGDIFFRSPDGIRSLVQARKDFDVWGNVPSSFEVSPTLAADDQSLLQYSSAIVFDNRLLMTANPIQGPQGVYHSKLIALNLDPISSLRGKQPSVYDGIWTDLNVLQLVTGQFDNQPRAYAFCYNPDTGKNELWEIFSSENSIDTDPITLDIEFPVLYFGNNQRADRTLLRLLAGELYVDNIQPAPSQILSGEPFVTFKVYFRADFDSTWHLWRQWNLLVGPPWQSRMGLGEPPSTSDPLVNRPWREGYNFQMRLVIEGRCVFKGARFRAVTLPESAFAPIPKSL